MAKLLSLFNYEKSHDTFLPYFLFSSSQKKALDFLSPDLMKITEDIFVVDLHITHSYWKKRAEKKELSLTDLLTNVFNEHLPQCELSLFCQHPFQGLVFFLYLQNQKTQGTFSTHSLFARKIYQNMGWEPWLWAARLINECFEKNQSLNKERKNFATHLTRFLRFIERTDMAEFSQLQQAHFYEIQRRFKGFLGLLWLWTFPSEDSSQHSLFSHYEKLKGFPWTSYKAGEVIEVNRVLEYPLSQWDELEPLLLADCEKLQKHPQIQSPYKLLQLQWTLTLYDLSLIKQQIEFKHPLCLSLEKQKEFKTLMKQLSFAFNHLESQLKDENKDFDVINTPLTLGWSLQISQKIQVSEKNYGFLLEEEDFKSQEGLESLNNKMNSSLQSFVVLETFIPGFDFINQSLQENQNQDFSKKLLIPKPFYLYPQAKPLDAKDILKSQFLDRTSQDWWNRSESLDAFRDCFICQLKNKELIFAYRNFKGDWFQYGL